MQEEENDLDDLSDISSNFTVKITKKSVYKGGEHEYCKRKANCARDYARARSNTPRENSRT